MANLSKDIQCVSSNTRPPMLDRTDFVSWKQCIQLYCRGKENGVKILKLIDEGPFQMRTFRETLVEGNEGALHLGPERARVYYDLSPDDKDRFTKLINNMRKIKMAMPKMQLNSKFVINMLPEWGRFVTVVKLNRGLKESNYDQLYAYLKQHEAHANENKMRVNKTEVKATIQGLQVQLVIEGLRTELGMQILVKLDILSVITAMENGVVLDEEQLLFLAGSHDTVVDEDVDESPVQDLALNVDNVFQADECDAFDSDVDEAPTAQTMFMTNLSLADLVYNEAGPSYDSDILSEVHEYDNYQDAVFEHHDAHEMHHDVQPNYVVDSNAYSISNSNMIPYDQYVKDNAKPAV
ncbi:hypothetical protein Tco_0223213 [Tanacetum coccineum]